MRQAKPVLIGVLGLGLAVAVAALLWRQAPEAALLDVSSGSPSEAPVASTGPSGDAPAGPAGGAGAVRGARRGPTPQGAASATTHGASGARGDAEPGPADDADAAEASVWPVDSEGIRGAMAEAMPGVQDCYEGWLAVNPDIAGRVELSFTIDAVDTGGAVGGVTELTIPHSELGHAAMESCVANVAAGLQFDVPDEPVDVTYPFVFETE